MNFYDGYGNKVTNGESAPLNGKKAVFLGDSITYLNNNFATKNYWAWVSELTGMACVPYGVGGSCITYVAATGNSLDDSFCVRYATMDDDADIVVVAGGTNDANIATIGKYGDTDNTTLYGALGFLMDALRTKYPTSQIIFMTPCDKYNDNSGSIQLVAKAIKEMAEKHCIEVYDNRQHSGIFPHIAENKAYYTADGVHWNNAGHEAVGKHLAYYLMNSRK